MAAINDLPINVPGIRLSAIAAGIRYSGRRDLVVMELAPGSTTSGVFTQNAFCAAPVTLCREHLQRAEPRFFLVNTGNANAGTGQQGRLAALRCCQALAQKAGVNPEQVLPFSTGVIGEALPEQKIIDALDEALASLASDQWQEAATGIMTTDTVPKLISKTVILGGKEVTVCGIAKGAGMIKPNMATMLGYVFTDAVLAKPDLQTLLATAASQSFNRITVDGDTSTNDCCMLVATGASGVEVSKLPGSAYQDFEAAL
ncbi:MAG: bifunctional ornithine acetyltransferase/N-acetylglutamate synthase, partial [Gammaproteobacteria bacterium]